MERPVLRLVYFVTGLIMTALGVIGAFLPVMPTTIFLILAVACFARSSPRMEHWIVSHPVLGPPVQDWRQTGAIARPAKIAAILSIVAGFGVVVAFRVLPVWGMLVLAAVLIAVSGFIVTRPAPIRR